MTPKALYKYLPSRFVDSVAKEGKILFRNLTYFRKFTDQVRGDHIEGMHVDNPDNDVTLSLVGGGSTVVGDFSFVNQVLQDEVYAFCMSQRYDCALYDEFESDACIVINDVRSFVARCKTAVRRYPSLAKRGILHKAVDYYEHNKPAPNNIKDPRNLPFFKNVRFRKQNEYRLVFGTKKGLSLHMKIVDNKKYRFDQAALKGKSKEKILRIGSTEDLVEIRSRAQDCGS